MKPEPRPARVSICVTAGLTAAATAATGSSTLESMTGVDPAFAATSSRPPRPLLFDSVAFANPNPPAIRTAAATRAAATRRPRRGREEPDDEGGQGGFGGRGGGGGGTTGDGAVIGAQDGASLVGGCGSGHVGGRMLSQSTSLMIRSRGA